MENNNINIKVERTTIKGRSSCEMFLYNMIIKSEQAYDS